MLYFGGGLSQFNKILNRYFGVLPSKIFMVDLTHKKFLIIDDFVEFRQHIKRMLTQMGVIWVDTVSNGGDALDKMKSMRYDVILSDYNLGEGKDGQEVLQEGRYKNYIKPTCIYIMITAETTLHKVMAVLECEPDGYLVKPFNRQALYARIKRLHTEKEKIRPLHEYFYTEQYDEALSYCNHHLDSASSQHHQCAKFKGRILLRMKRYPEAIAFYKEILKKDSFPWAFLGLAEAYAAVEEYDKAEKLFLVLTKNYSGSVEGFDGLADIYVRSGNFTQAVSVLKEAIKLSPRSVLRQLHIGKLGFVSQDLSLAERSLREAVRLARHSVYYEPDIEFTFVHALLCKANEHEGILRKKALDEIFTTLKKLRKKMKNCPEVTLKYHLYYGIAQILKNEPEQANRAFDKVFKLSERGAEKELSKPLMESLSRCFASITKLDTEETKENCIADILSAQESLYYQFN